MMFDVSNAVISQLHDELFDQKQVTVSVLRLDLIHPVISGNKLFKLHYFLEEASAAPHKTMLTFGGAYSNHLAATAHACSLSGIKSIGIVRGEQPAVLSPTLLQCRNDGMQLRFVSRNHYKEKEDAEFIDSLKNEFGACTIVPEGGYHAQGAKGAALISALFEGHPYTHICTALGTATTAAGLLLGASPSQKIVAIPVLKGMADIPQRIVHLTGSSAFLNNFEIIADYHFGGYAKKTDELISFMQQYWEQHKLPLDFVYTAKLFYAITDLIKKDHFPRGSQLLCLHTGGLQGNRSLPANTLPY